MRSPPTTTHTQTQVRLAHQPSTRAPVPFHPGEHNRQPGALGPPGHGSLHGHGHEHAAEEQAHGFYGERMGSGGGRMTPTHGIVWPMRRPRRADSF